MGREEPGATEPLASKAYRWLLLHPLRLLKRLLAEHATPRGLAAAAALGTLVGVSPFFGVHTLLVLAFAQRLGLNRLMALGTNQLGAPPLAPAICIEVGYYVRHGRWLTEVSLQTLGREAAQRFWEWLIGACLIGPPLALVVGAAVWVAAATLQRRAMTPGS